MVLFSTTRWFETKNKFIDYMYNMFRNIVKNTALTFSICRICLYEKILYSIGSIDKTTCVRNIIDKCSNHNVLIIKIVQSLMGFSVFPPDVVEILKQNTHSVRIEDSDIDIIELEKIKKDYNIELLSKTPFHAGMIGVVYSGIMNGNQKVIIKLKRNGIEEKMHKGCKHTFFMYNLLDKFAFLNKNLKTCLLSLKSITQTTDYLISQCDFANEIKAMQTTKSEVSDYPLVLQNIVIPEVYNTPDDIPNTNFIVMEYLEGVFANDLTDMNERSQYLEELLKYNLLMAWLFTYYHTDLHCGNVIYMKDGKVGLIDFGMVVQTSDFMKEALRYFIDIQQKNIPLEEAYRCINYVITEKIDFSEINDDVRKWLNTLCVDLLDKLARGEFNEYVLFKVVDEVSIYFKRKLIIDREMFLVLISTAMLNSTIKVLSNYDTQLIEEITIKAYLGICE